MTEALRAGLDPSQFWLCTPHETRKFIKAANWRNEREEELGMFIAWHTAAFMRGKRLPPLKSIMKGSKPTKKLEGNELAKRKDEFDHFSQLVNVEELTKGLNDNG